MHTTNFHANVQYDDLQGSAAADRADKGSASEWLKASGLLQDGEYLLGIKMFAGENHGKHKDPVYVQFLLASAGDFDTVKDMVEKVQGPIVVRVVEVQMPLVDFFALFKRFSVTLSSDAMLEGRDYTYADY